MSLRDKIATIVPLSHLDQIKDDHYQMALSHACENSEYMGFFADRVTEGKYVILDNSTVELGEPEDFGTYLRKAREMQVTEIILPDWLQDSPKTIEADREAMAEVKRIGWKGNVMAVPQGRTQAEWIQCCREMLLMGGITTIGISRRYMVMFGESRLMAVLAVTRLLMTINPSARIHLLGCSAAPEREIPPILNTGKLRGVDSGSAAFYAKNRLRMKPGEPRPPGESIDVLKDEYAPDQLQFRIDEWITACIGTAANKSREDGGWM